VLKGYRLVSVPLNPLLREELEGKSMEELTSKLASYRSLHNTTDIADRKRLIRAIEIEAYQQVHAPGPEPEFASKSLVFGLRYDRFTERKRITARLQLRLHDGMIEEVQQLMARGLSKEQLLYYGLEYKFLTLYLTGELTYSEMFGKLNTAIHQFAKRQMTWFRKMEREGLPIHWLKGEDDPEKNIGTVLSILGENPAFAGFLSI